MGAGFAAGQTWSMLHAYATKSYLVCNMRLICSNTINQSMHTCHALSGKRMLCNDDLPHVQATAVSKPGAPEIAEEVLVHHFAPCHDCMMQLHHSMTTKRLHLPMHDWAVVKPSHAWAAPQRKLATRATSTPGSFATAYNQLPHKGPVQSRPQVQLQRNTRTSVQTPGKPIKVVSRSHANPNPPVLPLLYHATLHYS